MGRRSLILALALAAYALAPASAHAASILYIGPDGNAHLVSPDGAQRSQVTRDGTPDSPYRMTGQTDAGTVVVGRRLEGDHWFHWLNRDGSTKSGPWLAPKGNLGTGPLSSHVSNEGNFVVFWASNCTFACQSRYDRIVFMPEGPLASECNVNCHDGYVSPRWVPGRPVAGFMDTGLNEIYVQVENSGPQSWFGFQDANVTHFDLTRDLGRVVTEVTPSTATTPVSLVLLKVNGLPPNAQTPEVLCEIENFAPEGGGNPVWSPDGTEIAFTQPDGVHVSGVSDDGSTCGLPNNRLVAPGGKNPEWGPQNVPTSGGPGGGPGSGAGAGPAVTFTVAGRLPSLARALKNGIAFFVRTNRAARALVQLLASGPFARGVSVVEARTRVVGRGSRRLPRAGRYKVVARFTRKAKRRYRRLRRVKLTARVTVRANNGRATTKRRRIILRR